MLICNHPIAPRRGNELLAQGIALGGDATMDIFALKGQKHLDQGNALSMDVTMLLPLQGVMICNSLTQDDALGYVLAGLTGRLQKLRKFVEFV